MEMFPGLGHDAFVRGDDHHHQVNARCAGDHVFDEPFVAGNIHNADGPAARQGQ